MSALPLDAYQLAARTMRERVKNKSYRAYPMGQEGGEYLRWKRGRITPATYEDIERLLDRLAREFPDLEMKDFEPPVGTQRLEEFLDGHWGDGAPGTYNKYLAWCRDFFKWAVLKGKLHGDPTLPINRHKKRDIHREIFADDARAALVAAGPDPRHVRRDRIALHLLIKYGIRKGALQRIQFKHFDANRRRLTIFTKGAKVRELPLVDAALWDDLAKLQLEIGAEPHWYLVHREKKAWRGYTADGGNRFEYIPYHDKPLSSHGMHDWWYRCLTRAGIVAEGTTRGEKMHKARHTAGQNVLDKTGNIKAVQKLLGHASIQTTADIYTDWDIDQLAETMRMVEGDA